MGVIHQDERDPIIGRDVPEAYILSITAKIGEAESLVVQHLEKPSRAAAMLNVGPPGFRHAREVEAVARRDEPFLVIGETIEFSVAGEILPELSAPLGLLRRPHARRIEGVEKSIGHR